MAEQQTYQHLVHRFRHFPVDVSGYISDDSGWSDQAILDHILDTRATIIERRMREGKNIGVFNVQTLSCIELEETDMVDCLIAPPSGCYVQKSILPIPRTKKTVSVTDISSKERLSYVPWSKVSTKFNSRSNKSKNQPFYSIRDKDGQSYLYVFNAEFLELVSLEGIPENPYEYWTFPGCLDKNELVKRVCNPWDTPFYADRDTIDLILKLSWQTLPQVRAMAGPDNHNDSVDNTKGVINTVT